jgi:hypothetical protein
MKTSTPKARRTTSGKGNKMHAPIASANHFESLTKSPHRGLTGHLKTHFPAIYRLFLLLKDCNKAPR